MFTRKATCNLTSAPCALVNALASALASALGGHLFSALGALAVENVLAPFFGGVSDLWAICFFVLVNFSKTGWVFLFKKILFEER